MSLSDQQSPVSGRIWLAVGCVVMLAIAVRFCVALLNAPEGWYNTDSYAYIKMARAILAGEPIAYFPNGFPLYLAGLTWLLGSDVLPVAAVVLSVLMSGLCALMVFLLARRILDPALSLLACAVVAFWPNQINYVQQIMSEVPAVFVLLLAFLAIVPQRRWLLCLSGLGFFLAGFIRTPLIAVGWLVVLLLWAAHQRKPALHIFCGLVLGHLMMAWLYHVRLILPPSNFGPNLLIAITNVSHLGIDWSMSTLGELEKSRPLETFLRFMVNHPAEFVWQRLSSFWELWGPWPFAGNAGSERGAATRVLIGLRFPVFLLAVYALWHCRWNLQVLLYGVPFMVVTLVHTAFFSSPRFSYTAEPFALMLAILSLQALWPGRRS